MSQLFLLVFKALYFLWFTGGRAEVKMEPLAPPPPQAAGLPRKAPVIIRVTADGGLSFEGQKLALDVLQQKLAARIAQEKDFAVMIRGDAAATLERIAAVAEACGKAGVWNVSLETERNAGPQFEEERD
ncbi:biopolymer transporter ExbD [Haloferula sp. BvORR071]|uniref:ExbD/TolR family protein n=1 Tax=Haloferula sp. BvORR071 TaxID=1396141 RepID=UPI00054F7D84|nr:biopolymer transporter ExbD [Haloferula sp. BvORR071]